MIPDKTPKLEVLNYVYKYNKANKRSPTYRQIAEYLGINSNRKIGDCLRALEADGFIIRAGTTRGQIKVTELGVRAVRRFGGK